MSREEEIELKNDLTKTPVTQAAAGHAGGTVSGSQWAWYLGIAVVLTGYLLLYAAALPELVYDWFNYYGPFSYCAVIPLMSAFVVWRKRASLRHIRIEPALIGGFVVLAAAMLGLVGKAMGDSFAMRVSMVLAIAGLVLLLLGKRFFRSLVFPIAFLFLMIPWPFVLVKEVAYHLRIINAVLAEGALRLLGVIVYRDSYFLHLPNITLEVADLCSGISSVFALFALGSYYAYFLPLRNWMKLVIVSSTVPFAVVINLLRIILTSLLAYYVGPSALHYVIHELTGIITFFIALALFIALGEAMQRRMPASVRAASPKRAGSMDSNEVDAISFQPEGSSWVVLSTGCFILFFAVFLSWRLEAVHAIPLTQELGSLPEQIGGYRSGYSGWNEPYHDANAEQELSRYYTAENRDPMELYLGYRSYQHDEKRLRSPKLTMLSTWNFVALEQARLPLSGGGSIDGMWMVLQKNAEKQVVLYWYQDGPETFAGEVGYRFHQAKKMIIHKRTEGTVVRIATPLAGTESLSQAKKRIAALSLSLYPELVKILPK